MNELVNRLKTSTGVLLFYVFRLLPIKKNKIVISSFAGKGFGDNGKYIVEKLLGQSVNYDIVWLTNDRNEMPSTVRTVPFVSVKSFYEQATAKIWIDNRRKPVYVRKRKQQYYIMTWHAGISLKKVEADAGDALDKGYIRAAKHDSKMIDLFLSGGKWETNLYREAFWYEGKILESGYPRQDILFNKDSFLIHSVKKKLGIDSNKKIVLYAPTFRKYVVKTMNFEVYNLNWDSILESLKRRFDGEWVALVRMHPNIAEYSDALSLPKTAIDVSKYPDMQELMLISDCMITDYSSSITEYGILERPGFIYAPDVEYYKKDRDTYFELDEMPFPMAETQNGLIKNIQEFDTEKYDKALYEFLYTKCGIVRGGDASGKIADIIQTQIN